MAITHLKSIKKRVAGCIWLRVRHAVHRCACTTSFSMNARFGMFSELHDSSLSWPASLMRRLI